jgi:3-oxoacyl-[acyl-carrier-protein] synthase II
VDNVKKLGNENVNIKNHVTRIKSIAITSVGIVSPIGIGFESFEQALFKGTFGVSTIQSFDASESGYKYACEVKNFQPERYIGSKYLQYYDRITKLTLVASQLALKNINDFSNFGVVLGTGFSGLDSIIGFERNGIRNGLSQINPMSIANTVQNTPANQVNIKFGMTNLSETITSGICSGMDAIGFSRQYLASEDWSILCGGAEALCMEIFGGLGALNMLAERPMDIKSPACKPFDVNRSGIVPGEGAVMFVLESKEHAKHKKKEILAEIIGYGCSFDMSSALTGPVRAMEMALVDSGIQPDQVDYICASASGSIDGDRKELRALKRVFSSSLKNIPISSIKPLIGETFGASGAFQLAAAILMIKYNTIVPTYCFDRIEDEFINELWIPTNILKKKLNICMLNAFDECGRYSTLIIRRP